MLESYPRLTRSLRSVSLGLEHSARACQALLLAGAPGYFKSMLSLRRAGPASYFYPSVWF